MDNNWNNLKVVQLQYLGNGKWTVSHENASSSAPPYPQVTLTNQAGPYLLHFKIVDPSQTITFNKDDPIWVQLGSDPHSHIFDPQIIAVELSQNGQDLFVLDKNDNKPVQPHDYMLHYILNTSAGRIDPIIDNGGHSRGPLSATAYLPYVGVGLVIGLLIGLAIAWWGRRRTSSPMM